MNNVKVSRPYSSYNLFFTLERNLLLQERQGGRHAIDLSNETFFLGYDGLHLPPLPARYQHLILPANWYVPGRRKVVVRKHTKSHGLASFAEIPRVAARNWKTIDPVTKQYCVAVADILKERWAELPDCMKASVKKTKKKPAIANREAPKVKNVTLQQKELQQVPKIPYSMINLPDHMSSSEETSQRINQVSPYSVESQAPQQGFMDDEVSSIRSIGSFLEEANISDEEIRRMFLCSELM